jgi:tRNA-dihydrouridine synthase B
MGIARIAEEKRIADLAVRPSAQTFRGEAEEGRSPRRAIRAGRAPPRLREWRHRLCRQGLGGAKQAAPRHDDRPHCAGRPWIFREIRAGLAGKICAPASLEEVRGIMLSHLEALYSFYGEMKGVRVARKHLGWYCRLHPEVGHLPAGLLTTECAKEQLGLTREFLSGLIGSNARAA